MKTCTVLGLGQMGSMAAKAMQKLGYVVVGVDSNPENDVKTHYNYTDIERWKCDELYGSSRLPSSIVISCLPYFYNEDIAKWCIDHNIRYCDLGGNVGVSKAINDYAREKNSGQVFTDLGLAPGLVSILALKMVEDCPFLPDEVNMYVGGTSAYDRDNQMKYYNNWSIDGLVNEYFDDCEILEDRQIKIVKGMSGYKNRNSWPHDDIWDYEAFYTSGGAAHILQLMLDRGVKNCAYRTLREEGHYNMVRMFRDSLGYDNEQMKDVFKKLCTSVFHIPDRVTIIIHLNKDNINQSKKLFYAEDEFYDWTSPTAMQATTTFTLAAVADLMANGYLGSNGSLTYEDLMPEVRWKAFLDNLTTLGLYVDDSQCTEEDN